ncbi:PREDICTED: vasculin [Nanorana parkeri]|uniref:vasculin n=1 Tax=Nanorana parkeri TaxID=125878 RepID=UPI000854F6EE|nr:PREDICTED: vasculin [Nanorana parkeri]XP_018418183.1 PREDICTED: vasculin [Nanorana parkeri]
MAQHDFAPAWLNFPTPPPSTKTFLGSDKHSDNGAHPDSRYSVTRRRHNSSDAFDASLGRSNGGNFGRKEKNGWRSQGRNGSENVNHSGTFNGTGSRSRSSTFHGSKTHGHREGSSLENEATRKEDRERRKQFEAEDFPSLNPEHDKEVNQNKSLSAGVWEYPLNSKSRSSRMLVIRKGMKDDFSFSGYPITTSTRIPPAKNGMDNSKDLETKDSSPTKGNSNALLDENKIGSSSETFRPNRTVHSDLTDASQTSVQEEVDSSSFSNRINICQERDINLNFDQIEIPQGIGNSFTSRQITRSSTFPQEVVLSSSLEAEHRLLKEMGWQEDSENDETYAPLTEDEMREFQVISQQLQKNGLRKSSLLKNGLSFELKFDPWRNSTFTTTDENDDTETSSTDTSDDDF